MSSIKYLNNFLSIFQSIHSFDFAFFPQSYFLMCIEHDLPALVLFALLILGGTAEKKTSKF